MRTHSLAAAAIGFLVLTGCGSAELGYGEDLLPRGDGQKVVTLATGDRVALTSTTGHELLAQWGRDGSWSEGREVFRDDEHRVTFGQVQVRKAKGTVAFGVDIWRATPSEPGGDGQGDELYTALVLCHDGTCEPGRSAGILSGPEIDSDGSTVTFQLEPGRLLVWRRGVALADAPVVDLPRTHIDRLLEDGTLVQLGARQTEAGCVYELLTADQALVFHRVAATRPQVGLCGISGAEQEGPDLIAVYGEGLAQNLAFVREGPDWSARFRKPAPPPAQSRSPLVVDAETGRMLFTVGGEERELPLKVERPREAAVLVDDDTLVRLSCQSSEGASWRPTVTVAPVTARTWPAARPVPGLDEDLRHRDGTCVVELMADGPSFVAWLTDGDFSREVSFRRGDVGIKPYVDETGTVIE